MQTCVSSGAIIGVSVKAGHTACTRIPCRAYYIRERERERKRKKKKKRERKRKRKEKKNKIGKREEGREVSVIVCNTLGEKKYSMHVCVSAGAYVCVWACLCVCGVCSGVVTYIDGS